MLASRSRRLADVGERAERQAQDVKRRRIVRNVRLLIARGRDENQEAPKGAGVATERRVPLGRRARELDQDFERADEALLCRLRGAVC